MGGGGCILIIASALWSRVFRIGLVNVMKCIRERPDLDQELDNIDWNLQDEDGNNPLLAVAEGCEKSLKRLKNLLRGANEIKENHRRQTNKTEININAHKFAEKVKILRMLIQQPGINWNTENKEGDTGFKIILRNKELFKIVFKDVKAHVSKQMTKKVGDREITKTPVIFALENDLEEHIVKILVAGAETQHIVDQFLYTGLYSPAFPFVDVDSNPRKKIKLGHS